MERVLQIQLSWRLCSGLVRPAACLRPDASLPLHVRLRIRHMCSTGTSPHCVEGIASHLEACKLWEIHPLASRSYWHLPWHFPTARKGQDCSTAGWLAEIERRSADFNCHALHDGSTELILCCGTSWLSTADIKLTSGKG